MTTIDLRFADIPVEFMTLYEYIAFLERQIPVVVAREKQRLRESKKSLPADDPEADVARFLEDQLESGATTRFLTSSALIATWGLYEVAVQQVAGEIAKTSRVTLKLSDLRGPFLSRARKYFTEVLKFELHDTGTDWERLQAIATLRHALAHANGRLTDVSEVERRGLQSWASKTSGVTIVDDEYLVLSVDFVKSALAFIDVLITDLQSRTETSFPP